MDINCTDSCHYQKNGKCTLSSIDQQQALFQGQHNVNCHYYTQTMTLS